jgi:hypothetical protein
MSKPRQTNRPEAIDRSIVITRDGTGPRTKFGHVVVRGSKPSKEVVGENIERSWESLARLAPAIVKGGVTLRRKKDVPQYFADADEPGVFQRRLNGRTVRGRFVDGQFKASE